MTGRSNRRDTFHHGDLRNALLAAGVALAVEGGPDAVVLREATRRTGVAPNAAYRHFTDRSALLEAVAEVGMSRLAAAIERATSLVPAGLTPRERAWARLRAAGLAYLRYARDEPGLYRTAFSTVAEPVPGEGQEGSITITPFQLLNAALDDLAAAGAMPEGRREDAELVAWSAVHGLAMLLIDGPLAQLEQGRADRLGATLVDTVARGLEDSRTRGAARA